MRLRKCPCPVCLALCLCPRVDRRGVVCLLVSLSPLVWTWVCSCGSVNESREWERNRTVSRLWVSPPVCVTLYVSTYDSDRRVFCSPPCMFLYLSIYTLHCRCVCSVLFLATTLLLRLSLCGSLCPSSVLRPWTHGPTPTSPLSVLPRLYKSEFRFSGTRSWDSGARSVPPTKSSSTLVTRVDPHPTGPVFG